MQSWINKHPTALTCGWIAVCVLGLIAALTFCSCTGDEQTDYALTSIAAAGADGQYTPDEKAQIRVIVLEAIEGLRRIKMSEAQKSQLTIVLNAFMAQLDKKPDETTPVKDHAIQTGLAALLVAAHHVYRNRTRKKDIDDAKEDVVETVVEQDEETWGTPDAAKPTVTVPTPTRTPTPRVRKARRKRA